MALESMRERDRRVQKAMAGRARDTDEKTEAPAGQKAFGASIRASMKDSRNRLDIFGREQPAAPNGGDDDDEAA